MSLIFAIILEGEEKKPYIFCCHPVSAYYFIFLEKVVNFILFNFDCVATKLEPIAFTTM